VEIPAGRGRRPHVGNHDGIAGEDWVEEQYRENYPAVDLVAEGDKPMRCEKGGSYMNCGGGDAGRAEHEGSVKAQEVGGRLPIGANAVTAAMIVRSRLTADDETQSPRPAVNDKT
jgi:hypothetical protein